MDDLGKYLVIMSPNHVYHDLIHKKDLVYINQDQFFFIWIIIKKLLCNTFRLFKKGRILISPKTFSHHNKKLQMYKANPNEEFAQENMVADI